VNRQNLPKTCGGCHAGPYTAFQKSQHYALLQKGDTQVPVCSTCHGEAGFQRPSAKGLEAQCAYCHGPKGVAPRVERADAARTFYEALHESSDLLKAARPLINRVSDKGRRSQLDEAYQQAQVPLTEAIQAGHQFVYDTFRERLNLARQRIEALFAAIVDPRPQAVSPR
jgi:hypothetical protein